MKRNQKRGIVLMTAVVIAFVLLLWAVAALYRASFQTSSVMFSHRKSESYYLAKRAISRSIYFLNNDAAWVAEHTDRDSADTYTEGALCWVETVNDQMVLQCEAAVGSQTTALSVPLASNSRTDTHIYSISPSLGGGPDVISWTTENTENWKSLPPIPNSDEILSVVGTDLGDVFAIAKSGSTTILWRYREGRGWVQMPDLPTGVSISELSVGRSERLVAIGSDNTVLMLPISNSLNWDQISPPTGATLQHLTLPVTSSERAYSVSETGSGPAIHQYDFNAGNWTQLSVPTAAHFDPSSGALVSQSGTAPNFEGGIAVDDEGHVFVASNPTGEPSVIYEFQAVAPGSTAGTWRTLPPVPAFQWSADNSTIGANQFSSQLQDLSVDDEGLLWVQWQDPGSDRFSTIQIDPGNN
ncbi:MAG: hypothetical protein KC800_22460 [Candidatus Eremiobacteraeota bacterium]|nr:hypothetical protein [Candidatus Eremiobacteraeota bacterium]